MLSDELGFELFSNIRSVIGKTLFPAAHGNDSRVVCIANIANVLYKHP